MVLTKSELISALNHEVHILGHLMSKVESGMLDYRPSPKQRSLLELLQYLTIVGPIHMQTALADAFVLDDFKRLWSEGGASSKALDLHQIREAISSLSGLFASTLTGTQDEKFREDFNLFGRKATRGSWLVTLTLNHYVAYRMQVFLYLKAAGCDTLSTMNLWAGVDG